MEDFRRRITAVDTARHDGLAQTTALHVLAGRAGRVRIDPESQERGLQAAEELGCRAYEADSALPLLRATDFCGLKVPGELSLEMFHSKIESFSGSEITTNLAGWARIRRESVRALQKKIGESTDPLPPVAVLPPLYPDSTCALPGRQ